MLTKSLINNNIPRLQLQDSVGKALQLVNDFRVSHLPVIADDKFLGLISEDDLLDAGEEKLVIEALESSFIRAAVRDDIHFLNAINISIQFDTSVVPVVNAAGDYEGAITAPDLLKILGNFTGAGEIGGIIVLEMTRPQFAISEISRIVESNNSTILHLNTTTDATTGMLTVTLHINRREISAIVSTFERYDYSVIYHYGAEELADEITGNYQHLMHYLDL